MPQPLPEAQRAGPDAHRQDDQQLARSGVLDRTRDPARRLADVDRDIAAAEHELGKARARIAGLVADPALLGQPADWLAAAREDWRTRRVADPHQACTAPPRPAAAHRDVPRPESERRGPSLTRDRAAPGPGR